VNLADLDALADLEPPTWTELERQAEKPKEPRELQFAFVRTFRGPDGLQVLEHLQRATIGRALPATATDGELRHLEGQRALVLEILNMIHRGSRGEEG
jgi:hypothetical protein